MNEEKTLEDIKVIVNQQAYNTDGDSRGRHEGGAEVVQIYSEPQKGEDREFGYKY